MRIIKKILPIIILLLTVAAAPAQDAQYVRMGDVWKVNIEGSDMKNLYMVDKGVYRGEQPSREDFRKLEGIGIKEVLSLRNWHSDKRLLVGTSIKMHWLQKRASKINEDDLIEALRIIRHRQGPILIHCWHGSDRTGAVVAAYRIVEQGWSKEDAIKEMVGGGFGFHKQFDEIVYTLINADIDRIKREIE